jgi:polysaccharide biosynthesis/export protein
MSETSRQQLSPRATRVAAIVMATAAWFTLMPLSASLAGAQPRAAATQPPRQAASGPAGSTVAAPAPDVAPDYVIGPTDVLSVVFWGDRDLSTEVTVRPDGKISLPLLNDVVAAGQTPEQLRQRLTETARRFVQSPVVTVVVRQVNNNRAFITGQINNPGPYVLSGPTTVLQMIAMAGGFTEFADRKHVLVTRIENGAQRAFAFNYDDVVKKHDLRQNVILKAGDTIVVP